MKRFFVILLLLPCILQCSAQSDITERGRGILNEYMSGIQSGVDVTPLVVGIKDMYGKANAKQQEEFKEMIAEVISEQLANNQKDIARSLIYIYQMISEQNDKKLPLLYFLLGNMYAEQMDSTNLKNAISSLKNCIEGDGNSIEYLNGLNGLLEQIRRYIPVTRGIEGNWISDVMDNSRYLKGLPKYQVSAVRIGDDINYIISGAVIATFNTKVFSEKTYFVRKEEATAQIVKEFGEDSLYICWASEKLSNADLQNLTIARGMASTIGTGVAVGVAGGNKDFSSRMAGQLSGMALEVGMNALFNSLFSPSKKLILIEAWLRKVNRNMFEGIFSCKQTKATTISDDLKFNERRDTLTLMRWNKESNVIFMTGGYMGYVYPYCPYVCQEDIQSDTGTEFGKACLEYKKAKKKKEFVKEYNFRQIEKLRMWCMENQ